MLLLFVFTCSIAIAQTKEVTGTVTDAEGTPIAGATVRVVGGNAGTATDADGKFNFTVLNSIRAVRVIAIGFQEQTVDLTGAPLTIVLTRTGEAVDAGDEVIVTASGLRTKRAEVGYAATTLKSENLTQTSPTNVTSALAGKVPGLQINGVSSGVNPNYSIILRGYRSITGNNQALIVLDNVIVPNSVLGNLNPQDIESIDVLNGASAAALYGSLASNGALIVTTKRGNRTRPEVTVSQTLSVTDVAYLPEVQKRFGSGSSTYITPYNPYENQQYGPEFDGSMVEIGDMTLPGGDIQRIPYAWNEKEGKLNFWKPGLTSQTDFSVSSPTSNGQVYFSGQYLSSNGTIDGDKYNRASVSIGGSQRIIDNLTFDYTARYVQNRYEQANDPFGLYELVLNSPGHIPLTRYENWRTDSFAMPDYYYNAFYNNPYFLRDNNRQEVRNDYLVSNVQLKYEPFEWLDLIGRVGMTASNQSGKNWVDVYRFSQYAKDHTHGSYKTTDITGSVGDFMSYNNKIIGDFIATFFKTNIPKWNLRANLGTQVIQDDSKALGANIAGLGVPGLFNLSNLTTPATATEGVSKSRTFALWAEIYATYNEFLTIHATGRRDLVSVLDPGYNAFFYPSVDVSFIASRAIPFIRDSRVIDYLKIRGGISNTGSVNIGPYSTRPTIGQGAGYPYSGNVAYTIGDRLITPGLKPEFTLSKEIGFDLNMVDRIDISFTAYSNRTKNQTLPVSISPASGYSSILTNTGLTSGKGIEASLGVDVVKSTNWGLNVGVNYTYNDNKVLDLGLPDLDIFRLLTYTNGTGVYAAEGKPFPALYVTTHLRDTATGKIIVDPVTGYPSVDPNIKYAGNAQAKHRVGVTLDGYYKNFSLRAIAEYRGDYVIYNAGGTTFDFTGAGINTVMFNRQRFVFPNSVYWDGTKYVENTNITVADGGADYWPQSTRRTGITENYVTSGAFWKLREVSLLYDLPNTLFSNSKFFKGASLNLVGRNLLILLPKTNVYTDPEFSDNGTGNYVGLNSLSQNPPSRYYGATLTLKF